MYNYADWAPLPFCICKPVTWYSRYLILMDCTSCQVSPIHEHSADRVKKLIKVVHDKVGTAGTKRCSKLYMPLHSRWKSAVIAPCMRCDCTLHALP